MTKWKFRPKAEGEIKSDPIQSRFFTTSDVGDITSALVREAVQNSLDARIDKDNKPAIIRLLLCNEGINPDNYQKYFEGLIDHLRSNNSGLADIPNFDTSMPYLVIEDYNTTGLEGDIYEDDDELKSSNKKQNFYWFWRNVARSGKGENDIGRWGVGKTVYSASSRINTFFGLTIRKDDYHKYLMGKSVLKWHQMNDNRTWYCPYGFFSVYKSKDSHFAIPINSNENSSFIQEFENTFNLQRNGSDNNYGRKGLSVIIPFPKSEIHFTGITKAAIKQYFYPILEGKLIIKVETDAKTLVINKDSISKILDDLEFEEYEERLKLAKIFNLARTSFDLADDQYIKLKDPPIDKPPRWQDSWLYTEDIHKSIPKTIIKFENGDLIAFKIPLKVHEIGKNPIMCYFKAFIQYDGTLKETDSYFIRDGVTISGVRTIKKKGLRVLILLDEHKLAMMFGDSENPAHTEFQKDSPHFLNKYQDGAESIAFLTNTVSNLYNLLMRPTEGTDEEILKDIFYIETDPASQEVRKKPKGKKGQIIDDIPDIKKEANVSAYKIHKTTDGFIISNNAKSERKLNHLSVKFAYLVPKGDPFKRYNIWDFNLEEDQIKIEYEGAEVVLAKENIVKLNVIEKDFKVQLTGFDINRDLYIKVVEL